MNVPKWVSTAEQMCSVGRHTWSVPRLHVLSKDLPVMDVPLDHLYIWCTYKKLTLRDMVMHMKAVEDADLEFPILLDEDGVLLDGRHRIMKALLRGAATIKAVRFETNPSPCKVSDA